MAKLTGLVDQASKNSRRNQLNPISETNPKHKKSKKISIAETPQTLIKEGRKQLSNQQIDEAVNTFKQALEFSENSRNLMDCISSGYHLGSSYVMKLQATEAISILVRTIGWFKDLTLIRNLAKRDSQSRQILADFKRTWSDTAAIVDNDDYADQIKPYKLHYHMAKAFDISNQLKFAADYYKHTLVSLDEGNSFSNSELSTKAQNGQFNVAVEKVTIERIRGDASLRLAICLLKLNSNETAPASFLSDSFAYLTKAIDVYRMLKRDFDLAYTLIWLLRASHLASVMEQTEVAQRYDVDRIVAEAEESLDRCETDEDSAWKHKEKLKTELGYVAAQMSHDRAETLLSTTINTLERTLEQKQDEQKGTSNHMDREWIFVQNARAKHGLSEYRHNKGDKKGAFKVLIDASKDYARAGNELQRCKCLTLAVENGIKFLMKTDKRQGKHADHLLSILDCVIHIYNEINRDGGVGVMDHTARDAFMLKSDIYEMMRDFEKAEVFCEKGYQIFKDPEDEEKLADLVHRKINSKASAVVSFNVNELSDLEKVANLDTQVKIAPTVQTQGSKSRRRKLKTYRDILESIE